VEYVDNLGSFMKAHPCLYFEPILQIKVRPLSLVYFVHRPQPEVQRSELRGAFQEWKQELLAVTKMGLGKVELENRVHTFLEAKETLMLSYRSFTSPAVNCDINRYFGLHCSRCELRMTLAVCAIARGVNILFLPAEYIHHNTTVSLIFLFFQSLAFPTA